MNDVYCAADNKCRTTLLHRDLSSAFDTLDTTSHKHLPTAATSIHSWSIWPELACTWCVARSHFASDRNSRRTSFVLGPLPLTPFTLRSWKSSLVRGQPCTVVRRRHATIHRAQGQHLYIKAIRMLSCSSTLARSQRLVNEPR